MISHYYTFYSYVWLRALRLNKIVETTSTPGLTNPICSIDRLSEERSGN